MFFELKRDWLSLKERLLVFRRMMHRRRFGNARPAANEIYAFKIIIDLDTTRSTISATFMKNGVVLVADT
jgi:hypothetical protein